MSSSRMENLVATGRAATNRYRAAAINRSGHLLQEFVAEHVRSNRPCSVLETVEVDHQEGDEAALAPDPRPSDAPFAKQHDAVGPGVSAGSWYRGIRMLFGRPLIRDTSVKHADVVRTARHHRGRR